VAQNRYSERKGDKIQKQFQNGWDAPAMDRKAKAP